MGLWPEAASSTPPVEMVGCNNPVPLKGMVWPPTLAVTVMVPAVLTVTSVVPMP